MIKDSIQYGDYIFQVFPELKTSDDCSVKTLTFQVTQNCSLRCTYCYQHEKFNHVMSFDIAKRCIDFLFENKDREDFYFYEKTTPGIIIDFIGGEPLLEISLIRQICDYFESRLLEYPECPWLLFHKYSFSSNGIAYFDKAVQNYLAEYADVVSMSITIDGCKELHDKCRVFPDGSPSYDIAIKAALAELKNGNDSTKITLSPENISYVFEGFKNLVELGFTHIHMNSMYENVWKEVDAVKLFRQLVKIANYIKEQNLQNKIYFSLFDPTKYQACSSDSLNKNWCGATDSMLAVDYKGEFFPCVRFIENSLGSDAEPFIIGDINTGISRSNQNIQILNSLTKKEQSTKECLQCPVESGCSWCSAYNYQCGGINCRQTNICYNHKAAALAAKYFFKLINDKDSYDKINVNEEFIENTFNKDFVNVILWENDDEIC